MTTRSPYAAIALIAATSPLLAQLRWEVAPHALRPAPRYDHAMTGYAFLFGGRDATQAFADTWVLEPWGWQQVTTANAPGARSGHTLAASGFSVASVAHSDILLFGGEDLAGNLLGDTWRFVGHHTATSPLPVFVGNWQPFATVSAPTPRAQHAMAYDWATNTEILLFGGRTAAGANDETWRFASGVWTHVQPPTRPPARYGHALLAGPDGFVLVGGTDGATEHTDAWRFDGATWAPVAAPGGAAGRVTADWTMRGRHLVVASRATASGITTTLHERTYDGIWLQQEQVGAVPLRTGQSLTAWGLPHAVVAFGGRDAQGNASDETLHLAPVHDAAWRMLGSGCGPGAWSNQGPDLFPGTWRLGGTAWARMYTASANTLLALGVQLGTAPAPACSVTIAPDLVLGFVTDTLGLAEWTLAVPFDAGLRGLTLSMQALAFEPQGPNGLALSRLLVLGVGD